MAFAAAVAGWSCSGNAAETAAAAPVDVDQQTKDANAICLGCHSEAGLKNPPRPDMHLQGLANLLVSTDRFDKSVHSDVACKDCHGDSYTQYPHAANSRFQIKMCPECHKSSKREKLPEFMSTVHYKNHPYNFTCVSCHNPHTLQAPKTLGSAKKLVAQDNGMCIDCHNSDQRYAQFTTDERPNLVDLHKFLPNPELHWKSVRCIDCHTPAKANGGTSHVILGKDTAEQNCSVCHNATSSLRTRLYRYFTEQGQLENVGFLNGPVLNQSYVVGATRNTWLDKAAWVITGLWLSLIGLHSLIRVIAGIRRKGRK